MHELARGREQPVQQPWQIGRRQMWQDVGGDDRICRRFRPGRPGTELQPLHREFRGQRHRRRVALPADLQDIGDREFAGEPGCQRNRSERFASAPAPGEGSSEVRAGCPAREDLVALVVGRPLQIVPDVGERVRVIGIALWKGVPRLLVQCRVVQALRSALDIFLVAGVPVAVELTPEPGRGRWLVDQRVLAEPGSGLDVPEVDHPATVDQHDRRILGRDRQIPVIAHLEIEQERRIGEIDLVDVVVDRPTGTSGPIRNSVAIVGEARPPARPVEAGHVLHQMDFVGAGRVAHPLDRVEEDALCPVLRLLGAEEDPHGRQVARRMAGARAKHDAGGPVAKERPAVGPLQAQAVRGVFRHEESVALRASDDAVRTEAVGRP
jgi:hypothetical protein